MKTLAMLIVLSQAAIAVLGNGIEGAEPADSLPAEFSAGKLAVWPDLARVDLVLDRQPFQHATSLKGVQWADGGRTLITSSNGFFAWDVESQNMLRRFSPQLTMSQMIAMSPDGTKLATISHNNQPRIYDWPTLDVLFAGPKSGDVRAQALVFSPDGKFLAVGFNTRRGNKSIVRVFNCANFEQEYGRQDRRIEALAWAPDSSYLVVAETRGTVIFLSPEGELIRRGIRLEPAESPVGLAVSADGRLLAICTRRSIGVYAVLGRQKLWYDTPEEQSSRSILQPIRPCFSADSSELFNLGWKQNDDSTFLVARDAETGKPLRELQAGNSSNNLLELSPDSKSLVFTGRNNSLEICDSATFKPIVTSDSNWPYTNMSRLRDTPVGMRVSPDGKRLLRFGWQHLAMWNLETGERMWTVKRPDHVRGAA
ncbi:MAG: WD40 repeat domain-containing protein, partial [Planctomycetes bacterium]|nr:WD40 repeat domain-containing protein [Planctomycetota bacterium]